ncbi:hypothetical protein [Streptomyces sp. NPDC004528]|uniref:hypothetical protein n=1 Tax=Streptomyces sp. NPDC004528 TaxID=3154550 RepID=UPI0033A7A4A7
MSQQQPYAQWGTPAPAPAPKNRKPWLTHGATALGALIIGAAIGSSGNGTEAAPTKAVAKPAPTVTRTETAKPKPAPTITVTKTVAAKPKPKPKPKVANKVSGDGQYLVGEEMQAGTYKTAGPADDMCYYERSRDASGDSIIDNDLPTGQARVTVKNGELFKTEGCQDWIKVG